MSVPHTLLGLLEQGPRHGYDLKRDYDTYFGRHKPLPFGQVYATLARLERDGKVSPGEVESGDGPDRKRYAITHEGKVELDVWLREPIAAEPHLQTMVFTKVALNLMQGRPAEGYLDTQRASHLERRKELNELKRTGTLVDALLADYGLFHLEADLRWIDITEARLSALSQQMRPASSP
jgi:DNA-binding PadR family transcriptional regulator